jgi:uncharacterized membrane protein
LLTLALLGASPLGWTLAGGFLLIGPVLLAGFFQLYRCTEQGQRPSLADALKGFASAGPGYWVLAGGCAFIFLVWVTDAGVLYAFQVGIDPAQDGPAGFPRRSGISKGVRDFALWSSPLGAFLALGIYLATAFSVPLLYERRAGVVPAIIASVRAVLGNPGPASAWAVVIVCGILAGILVPPLLAVTLPVLAYGSFALYRAVFPVGVAPACVAKTPE